MILKIVSGIICIFFYSGWSNGGIGFIMMYSAFFCLTSPSRTEKSFCVESGYRSKLDVVDTLWGGELKIQFSDKKIKN